MRGIGEKTLARASLGADGWVCQSCMRRSLQAAKRSFSAVVHVERKTGRYPNSRLEVRVQRTLGLRNFAAKADVKPSRRRQAVLPDFPARTRFAPSPTGHLHIGGLRTALFSYLLAKRTGGQFVLRIEDTDQKRLVHGAEERLLEDLQWAGLQWDEGPQVGGPYGPYKQSERNHIYDSHACELLDFGAAYQCFCTPQTAGQGSQAYVTSGCYQNCASLDIDVAQRRGESGKEPFTIRLKKPEDARKRVYPDLIYGKITPLKRSPTAIASADAETGVDAADTILLKSDGTPTYHFANVVDDHLMEITHVIRGTEWMASTPLHYDLYHAFGWTPPAFAHVGLLVDENKAKLSKRNSDLALDVRSMRQDHGVLPETLVNFLALLGWSNPTRDDVMDMQQLINTFDLKFTKGNTMVRMEKLWYLQKHHVANLCQHDTPPPLQARRKEVANAIATEVRKQYPDFQVFDPREWDDMLPGYCLEILCADGKSYQNPKQYVQRNRYFFTFDPAQVPSEQEDYAAKGSTEQFTASDCHEAISSILHFHFRDKQTYTTDFHHPAHLQPRNPIITDLDYPDFLTKTSNFKPAPGENPEEGEVLVFGFERQASRIEEKMKEVLKPEARGPTHRYLREKLAYGLPGPSVGVVMAVLGYKECCRRVGVEARDGGGW